VVTDYQLIDAILEVEQVQSEFDERNLQNAIKAKQYELGKGKNELLICR
jgi:hypothetical protein